LALLALVAGQIGLQAAYCDLVCFSVCFEPAEAPSGSLEFIAADGAANGELFPLGSAAAHTHGAFFRIKYENGLVTVKIRIRVKSIHLYICLASA
jgi:hypothetical protein